LRVNGKPREVLAERVSLGQSYATSRYAGDGKIGKVVVRIMAIGLSCFRSRVKLLIT
jgi:hypothetical protein